MAKDKKKPVADTPQNWKLIKGGDLKTNVWQRKEDDKGTVTIDKSFWHGWEVGIDDPKINPFIKIPCGRGKKGNEYAKRHAVSYMSKHPTSDKRKRKT